MSAENLKKYFAKIDADGSGEINAKEFQDLFKGFDKDGNGKVDPDEFAAGMAGALGCSREQSDKAFKALDTDNDKELDLSEISSLFKKMDKDGSGEVDEAEFVEYWLSLLK